MSKNQPSRTAEFMAFFRALESVRPSGERLFADTFAVHFVRPALQRVVFLSRVAFFAGLVRWYLDRCAPGARSSAVARTSLIDNVVLQALKDKILQIVILGAGFDCRAYRLPELRSAIVFEVDHPFMSASKLALMSKLAETIPANIRFCEADLIRDRLSQVLASAGFDSAVPALFLWEGVTNYLTQDAVGSVLRFVGACSAGTRLVFTYVDCAALDGSVYFEGAKDLLRKVAELGEPWTFGLRPGGVADFVKECGLRLDRDLSAAEYRRRCFGSAADRMRGYEFYHVAIAHREGLNAQS